MPATDSTSRISSGAYATLDIGSEANTGSAIRLGSSVCARRSLRNGRPTIRRLAAIASLDTAKSVGATTSHVVSAAGTGVPTSHPGSSSPLPNDRVHPIGCSSPFGRELADRSHAPG